MLSPGVDIQRALARAGGRLAEALRHARRHSLEWRRGLQAFLGEQRAAGAPRTRVAEALSRARRRSRDRFAAAHWEARGRSVEWGRRLQAFRADHRKVSTAVIAGVLLALALAGTGAAVVATSRNADVVAVDYLSRYVTVTGPGGTQTYEVTQTYETTVTDRGKVRKRTVVRTRVVKRRGGVKTLREIIPVAGPAGETKTVTGPTKTVTVKGPGQTVTQVVTEVVTTTVEVQVTVTEDCGKGC